jgi:hypothetical protein
MQNLSLWNGNQKEKEKRNQGWGFLGHDNVSPKYTKTEDIKLNVHT